MTYDDRHIIRLVKKEMKEDAREAMPEEPVIAPVVALPPRPRTIPDRHVLAIVAAVVVLIIAITYVFTRNADRPADPAAKTLPALSEEQILASVKALMLVPEETPVMALVTDLTPLKGQTFFDKAELGDVVLMFVNSSKAVLYRPATHKIIESGPLTAQ